MCCSNILAGFVHWLHHQDLELWLIQVRGWRDTVVIALLRTIMEGDHRELSSGEGYQHIITSQHCIEVWLSLQSLQFQSSLHCPPHLVFALKRLKEQFDQSKVRAKNTSKIHLSWMFTEYNSYYSSQLHWLTFILDHFHKSCRVYTRKFCLSVCHHFFLLRIFCSFFQPYSSFSSLT